MRVFVDACVLVSAFLTPEGPSGVFKAKAIDHQAFSLIVSREILEESTRAVKARRGKAAVPPFLRGLDSDQIEILPAHLSPKTFRRWAALVPPRDLHVLAGAFISRADVLVSIDADHILTRSVRNHFPILVFTPLEFLAWVAKHSQKK